MSSRFKIPKEIVVPVILLNGKSAKIISKSDAQAMCDLSDGKKPSARRCGSQKARSDRWPGTELLEVYKLTNFGNSELPPKRGLSSRMSPRHPRANGDFRRGAYHDMLDAGGDPAVLVEWGKQRHEYLQSPAGMSPELEPDPELIQVLRDLDEEPLHASAS
jgi:hypothetical protein